MNTFPNLAKLSKTFWEKKLSGVLRYCPFPRDIHALSLEELAVKLKAATNSRVGLKHVCQLLSQTGTKWNSHGNGPECNRTGWILMLSIPGIGADTAAGFLGKVGEIAEVTSTGVSYKNLLGWILWSRVLVRKSQQVSPLASTLWNWDPFMPGQPDADSKKRDFKALYRCLTTMSLNPFKRKEPLIPICNKLMRVMFALGKEKRCYHPNKVPGLSLSQIAAGSIGTRYAYIWVRKPFNPLWL